MLAVEHPVIRQRLFSTKMPDGARLYLAFLRDGGCAIARDEQILQSWDDAERSLELALQRFVELSAAAEQ